MRIFDIGNKKKKRQGENAVLLKRQINMPKQMNEVKSERNQTQQQDNTLICCLLSFLSNSVVFFLSLVTLLLLLTLESLLC